MPGWMFMRLLDCNNSHNFRIIRYINVVIHEYFPTLTVWPVVIGRSITHLFGRNLNKNIFNLSIFILKINQMAVITGLYVM